MFLVCVSSLLLFTQTSDFGYNSSAVVLLSQVKFSRVATNCCRVQADLA